MLGICWAMLSPNLATWSVLGPCKNVEKTQGSTAIKAPPSQSFIAIAIASGSREPTKIASAPSVRISYIPLGRQARSGIKQRWHVLPQQISAMKTRVFHTCWGVFKIRYTHIAIGLGKMQRVPVLRRTPIFMHFHQPQTNLHVSRLAFLMPAIFADHSGSLLGPAETPRPWRGFFFYCLVCRSRTRCFSRSAHDGSMSLRVHDCIHP